MFPRTFFASLSTHWQGLRLEGARLYICGQTFLIQQIRSLAGDPTTDISKKIFFIVTHSPHFIDVRTIDELKHTIIFQANKLPQYISNLESDDEFKLNSLLPRLNTHHKQFFFSSHLS